MSLFEIFRITYLAIGTFLLVVIHKIAYGVNSEKGLCLSFENKCRNTLTAQVSLHDNTTCVELQSAGCPVVPYEVISATLRPEGTIK